MMIVTKKSIPRRTMLRGLGAAMALPFLDGMVPALRAIAQTAASGKQRFGAVYVPNGMVMQNWTPVAEGAGFEFSPILQPLEALRKQVLILSGLDSAIFPGERQSSHPRGSTKFLTNSPPKSTTGSDFYAGVSIDQIIAKKFSSETQLASLEVSLESTESAASCEVGFSCAYTSTISWRTPTQPLPMENNPRAVFERLFGDGGTTDPLARLTRMRQQRSVIDSVQESLGRFAQKLGPGDRAKLDEYLEGVRDVERRIQIAEAQGAQQIPVIDQPVGAPAAFEDHTKLMYDLQVLAYQTDLTRVSTFMIGRELTGRQYPEIGVPDAHHAISHHAKDPVRLDKLTKIQTYHVKLFADYLKKLQSTPDGDGTLLDHTTILYGAGFSDSNEHSPLNLPMLVAGGGASRFQGGRHLRFPKGTPLANLNLTLLETMGVHLDKFGDSTEHLSLS
jgi:uncharacterized protein DUF1552